MDIIRYNCRYCEQPLGDISNEQLQQLSNSFTELFNEEIDGHLLYHSDGSVLIQTVCSSCEDALNLFPHYHGYKTFLH
jgi:hypothetical protein